MNTEPKTMTITASKDWPTAWPFPLSHTKQAAGIPQFRNSNQRQRRRDHRRARPHGWKGGAK
jgi:hypothetical protein